jgi:hypothetical protein
MGLFNLKKNEKTIFEHDNCAFLKKHDYLEPDYHVCNQDNYEIAAKSGNIDALLFLDITLKEHNEIGNNILAWTKDFWGERWGNEKPLYPILNDDESNKKFPEYAAAQENLWSYRLKVVAHIDELTGEALSKALKKESPLNNEIIQVKWNDQIMCYISKSNCSKVKMHFISNLVSPEIKNTLKEMIIQYNTPIQRSINNQVNEYVKIECAGEIKTIELNDKVKLIIADGVLNGLMNIDLYNRTLLIFDRNIELYEKMLAHTNIIENNHNHQTIKQSVVLTP